MFKQVSLNTTGARILSAGTDPVPVFEYEDGKRSDTRAKDAEGRPIVRVDVVIATDNGLETMGIKVPESGAPTEAVEQLAPVVVADLVGVPYVNNGRIAWSLRASRLAAAGGKN